MAPFLLYCKNLVQLILAPQKAWEEISGEELPSQELTRRGFYPLMAFAGATAFCHGLYHISDFSVGRQLQEALTQMVTLFVSLILARAIIDAALPRLSLSPQNPDRPATVCIYSLSLMAVVVIIMNLCPIQLTLLWFLPAFVAVTVWQARSYLDINPEKQGQYIMLAIGTLICLPVIIAYILGYIIVQ